MWQVRDNSNVWSLFLDHRYTHTLVNLLLVRPTFHSHIPIIILTHQSNFLNMFDVHQQVLKR